MSSGAKEVMIKAVAQAIPTYVMSVFKLPASLCHELTQLIRQFWWGEDSENRKVYLMAWDKLLMSKGMGGIGFRDLGLFNQALLARQAWRLIQYPDSLCARLLRSKYYPRGEIIDTIFIGDASPTWRGVEHGLELLKKGIIWRVGKGTKNSDMEGPLDTSSTISEGQLKEGEIKIVLGLAANDAGKV
jgi:hypothetical protein